MIDDADIQFDDTLLLIEPEAARTHALAVKKLIVTDPPEGGSSVGAGVAAGGSGSPAVTGTTVGGKVITATPKAKSFHGTAEVTPATAKMRLVQIAEEIISLLCADPNATVRVTLEIDAEFPHGA